MRTPLSNRRALRRAFRRFVVACCLSAVLLSGCHRSMYRINADREAYCLIDQKVSPECWPIPGYTIEPRPESRMFDPFDRDFPPMPPDDPTSHAYMHRVNCQDGYGCWHNNGDTQWVENPGWWQMLPRTETGAVVIDSESAMRLGLLHSPAYQTELEDLYLSALDVSFQRFQFDIQYFGGFSSFVTTTGRDRAGSGGQSSTQFEVNTFSGQGGNRLLKNELTASGAQLAIGLANSLIWELSGPDMRVGSSLIDFSIIQPLLRGAGRDVVLEALTQSERSLLANVRQMERYRREFYVEVITGRNPGNGPSQTGLALSSLNGQTDSSGNSGGYLGLLEDQQDIRNQRANIAALQSSVAQLEAFFIAGRIDYFQVEQARQALYGAQSRLLASERNLEASLDQFKLTLGLPPGVELVLKESLIEPFQLVDPAIVPLQELITRLQQSVGQTLSKLYEQVIIPTTDQLSREEREELPMPPEIRKKMEALEDKEELVPAKKKPDDADNFLDDPDEEASDDASEDSKAPDGMDEKTGLKDEDKNPHEELPSPGANDGKEVDDGPEEDKDDEADDERDQDDGPTGPSLKWDDNVASTLQTLKQNIETARCAIKRAAERHIDLAERDIKELRSSLEKRNRDANMLRRQLLQRMQEDKSQLAQRRQSKSLDANGADAAATDTSGYLTGDKAEDGENGEEGICASGDKTNDEVTEDDVNAVLPYRPDRLKQLPTVLEDTLADILKELERSDKGLAKIVEAIDELLETGAELKPEELFRKLQEEVFVNLPSELNNLAASVLSITLVQARARTESITLPSVNLDWENALSMARCNRLDWMNARAGIVDTWRQVQVTANDLESQLDLIVQGDIGNVGDNGLDIRPSTGRLRFGVEFDSPITRLAERNTYRESLINYQRARRDYYQFGDGVATSLRDILRRLRVNQINFELQRAAVDVAISQVELARLRLQEPPRPGEDSGFGATTARDLVSALNGLLNAQNEFLSVWVGQEVLRRSLDLDLGTMQLDYNGMWIDPGARLGWNENNANDLTEGTMEPLGDEFNSPAFDAEAEVEPEPITPPVPDPPAKIFPLPDAAARRLPPPVQLPPVASQAPPQFIRASPTQSPWSGRSPSSSFRPTPIQPVAYDQPILNADAAE